MQKQEIEVRTLKAIENARQGGQAEHSFVEFKSKWPRPQDAARSIGGLCNAAFGEPVLLVVGVDDGGTVIGAANEEGSAWKPAFDACFDGVPPTVLSSLNVSVGDRQVVAVLFETDRSPYLVRRSAIDERCNDSKLLEVPWRELQTTRSARREELLRLLHLHSAAPTVQVLDAELVASQNGKRADHGVAWHLAVFLYVTPRSRDRVVIPFHECELEVAGDEPDGVPTTWRFIMEPDHLEVIGAPTIEYSRSMWGTPTELVIDGPGCCLISAESRGMMPPVQPVSPVRVTATLRFVRSARAERIGIVLAPGPELGQLARWICTEPHPRGHRFG